MLCVCVVVRYAITVYGGPSNGEARPLIAHRSYKRAANICKDWGTLSGEGASFAQCDGAKGKLGKIFKQVK